MKTLTLTHDELKALLDSVIEVLRSGNLDPEEYETLESVINKLRG